MRIYCLINVGNSLTDEIAQLLFDSAQETIRNKNRTCRICLAKYDLKGEIVTEYKLGFMGTVAGIIFKANFDWNDGSSKTDFIVMPVKDNDVTKNTKWVREPLFPAENPDPVLN